MAALLPAQTGTRGLVPDWAVDAYTVHLVAKGRSPFLCGLPRFGDGAPGWSLRGGVCGPGVIQQPCPGCVLAWLSEFPGAECVDGVGSRELRLAHDLVAAQSTSITAASGERRSVDRGGDLS